MHIPTNPDPVRRPRRWRSLALGLVALGTMAGSALMVSGPAAAGAPAKPVPGDCQVIDFRTATVDPLVSPDPSATTHRLTVTGVLSGPANVSLVPLTYVRRPEHWEIEVVACPAPETKPPTLADSPVVPPFRVFRATLDFHGTLGSCGIDVVGAETRQRFDLAGPPACETFGEHS